MECSGVEASESECGGALDGLPAVSSFGVRRWPSSLARASWMAVDVALKRTQLERG